MTVIISLLFLVFYHNLLQWRTTPNPSSSRPKWEGHLGLRDPQKVPGSPGNECMPDKRQCHLTTSRNWKRQDVTRRQRQQQHWWHQRQRAKDGTDNRESRGSYYHEEEDNDYDIQVSGYYYTTKLKRRLITILLLLFTLSPIYIINVLTASCMAKLKLE